MARRRRELTPEDRDLWSRVAATAAPLHPRRKDGATTPEAKPAPVAPRARNLDPAPPGPVFGPGFRVGALAGMTAATAGGRHDLAPSPVESLTRQPLRMDHKTHRNMTRGKLKPEARIDLHGMTLTTAHAELTRFVMTSHGRGRRLVLVITGKGKPRPDDGPIPMRQGALRHQVPHWLQQPPLGGIILQIAPAHIRHGGEGAYYVYLRR